MTMRGLAAAVAAAAMTWAAWAQAPAAPTDKPWAKLYAGADATGPDVAALWQFQPGAEAADASGRKHDLALRGEAKFVPGGLFGSCLECFGPGEKFDKITGATAKHAPDLNMTGAFTLEMWIKPKPEYAEVKQAYLLDKKYISYALDKPDSNNDYMLFLRGKGKKSQLVANLGFGKDSANMESADFDLEPGVWKHVAFAYNGAGMGRFFVDGAPMGKVILEGRGALTPGKRPLVIGDRIGSNYGGFPGFIDQVRILKGAPAWLAGGVSLTADVGRTAFRRMEANARVQVVVSNDTDAPLTGGKVTAVIEGAPLRVEKPLADAPAGRSAGVALDIDTTLKPGVYALKVTVAGKAGDKDVKAETSQPLTIAPRPLPKYLPVVLWGHGDVARLKEMGFTHDLASLANLGKIWKDGAGGEAMESDAAAKAMARMDERLAAGLGAVASVSPGRYVVTTKGLTEKYERVDRQGKTYDRENPCCLFDDVQKFCYNTGAAMAKTFGMHPAWDGALIHTEIRDGTNVCFHDHDKAAYKAFAGVDIPAEVVNKGGLPYARIKGFPANRIVPDNHPVLKFYRWFWTVGDGWNNLHTQVHRGLKTATQPGLWTFFDPAVRCPPIWGSGGEVDVISQWTYTYPDPPKMGQATDELFAMAEGRPGQRVMKMTQIIWYRTGTAPNLPKKEEDYKAWEKEIPDAKFITIAPDHLSEAFWFKLSRPVQGIMYHGWGSLVEAAHGGYRYTNPQTRKRLAELVEKVAVPLGATLMQIPDGKTDVALLESFTSGVFGSRGTWGWGGTWAANVHVMLQWARLQPRIVYEETVLRDGLDAFKVLVMPDCDVLPKSVADRILAWQRKGGVIVADENLAPGLTPDVLIRKLDRKGPPDKDKATLQAMAEQLRKDLAPVMTWRADSSNADAIVRVRTYKDTDYLFVINDLRTYGDYVGHHRMVMEQGLPLEAKVSIRRKGVWVYDLLDGKAVDAKPAADGVEWGVKLGPGEGRVFMVSPNAVAGVKVEIAQRQPQDRRVAAKVTVVDKEGKPLAAVAPVKVEVLDPAGKAAEFSGYYGAKDGVAELALDLAANDASGAWTVKAVEQASGAKAEAKFEYRR